MKTLVERGSFDQAVQLADTITSTQHTLNAYLAIAKLEEQNKVGKIVEIIAGTTHEEIKPQLYSQIAMTVAENGNIQNAIDLAKRIDNHDYRNKK